MNSFQDFPLRPSTRAALDAIGVSIPTPIQAAALPELLAGRDLIGQARTGSGKTLAFAIPIVERLDERTREVQALVLAPTRELASQVAGVIQATARGRSARVLLLVGGVSAGPQERALRQGVHVVVGTPGRVLDHIRQGTLRLDRLRLLVLDEADEMLDRGFAPDVERIITATSPDRQTALFSATVPEWVDGMAARFLHAPVNVRVDPRTQPVEHVAHAVYDVPEGGKLPALRALLDGREEGVTLVFGRTKHGVKKLARQLTALGYPVGALQGNLSQNARDRVMADFRSGAVPILVATNVAARGLDVEHVARVINYELPETPELLTHRVGRTGRMGRAGEAITLLAPEDEPAWRKLLRGLHHLPPRRPWSGRHEPAPAAGSVPVRAASELPASQPPARRGGAVAIRGGRSAPEPYASQRRPDRPSLPPPSSAHGSAAAAPTRPAPQQARTARHMPARPAVAPGERPSATSTSGATSHRRRRRQRRPAARIGG